jgi:hypothetical protein
MDGIRGVLSCILANDVRDEDNDKECECVCEERACGLGLDTRHLIPRVGESVTASLLGDKLMSHSTFADEGCVLGCWLWASLRCMLCICIFGPGTQLVGRDTRARGWAFGKGHRRSLVAAYNYINERSSLVIELN